MYKNITVHTYIYTHMHICTRTMHICTRTKQEEFARYIFIYTRTHIHSHRAGGDREAAAAVATASILMRANGAATLRALPQPRSTSPAWQIYIHI